MLRNHFKTITMFGALLLIGVACSEQTETSNNSSEYNQHRVDISAQLEPLSIQYREDTCDYDGKQIRSKRFGAELETENGGHFKFCSAEHLIAYMMEDEFVSDENAKARVVEFVDGGKLIDPAATTVLRTPNQPSPGGMNFLPMASAQEHAIRRMQDLYTGELLSWEDAREQVAREIIDKK